MELSVVLATHNEAGNLERCLSSVVDLATEIIVVDGHSTDQTVAIARTFNAKIIDTDNKANFHINKQIGLNAATKPWILQLDADEEVSRKLASDIKTVLATVAAPDNLVTTAKAKKLFTRHQELIEKRDGKFYNAKAPIAGYFIPRKNMFLGRGMRYAGMYPDGVIRLVRSGKAAFPCKSVHEQIQIQGNVSWLPHDLIHYDSPTFAKYIDRANRYTSITAAKMNEEKLPRSLLNHGRYLFFKPLGTFLNLYFRHKGILDGFPGFVFALFSGLHWSLAYMKYCTDNR